MMSRNASNSAATMRVAAVAVSLASAWRSSRLSSDMARRLS
ncbi:hypothetical protein QP178_01210 [Sphingomonas aurantiaca]